MAMTPRLVARQSQSLTLTPQLMQSIRLLQFGHAELNAFIDAELQRNPLLEREDGDAGSEAETEPVEPEGDGGGFEDTLDHTERVQSADSIANGYDTDVENVFPEQSRSDRLEGAATTRERGPAGEGADLDQYVAAMPTLAEHLAAQVGFLLTDPAERLIAQFLIDGVDEAGYLRADLAAIAAQLGTSLAVVEAVLAKVQAVEPAGMFARSVAECLALQLSEKDRLDPLMQRLLDHLDLLAAHDIGTLLRVVGVDREDLADMVAELKRLDPRPGRAFARGQVEAVVPDVFVRRGGAGAWLVELNTDVLPRVLVNRSYHARVAAQARDAAEKTFLADCLQGASWLTRSLDQRARTIMKVAAEIVSQQELFLERGVAFLRPMTLRMVADAIGMHESTVSRVTSNKYLATPRGLFEMKFFFTTALPSSMGGDGHSAESVRHRIRQLIEAEPPGEVLSDDVIAAQLQKEQGIEVARRTVAKYREAMNIPSSMVRRRQKRTLALNS